MTSRTIKWSLVLATLVALGVAAWGGLRSTLNVSWIYSVEARFEKMPASDHALLMWLRAQPGIIAHTVSVDRLDDGTQLRVTFLQVRNLAGEPPFPDLDGRVGSMGYAQPDGPFRDSVDPHRALRSTD